MTAPTRSLPLVAALATPAVIVAAALAIAPSLRVTPGVTDAVTFVGGAGVGLVGVTVAARQRWSARLAAILGATAATVLVVLALSTVRARFAIVAVDTALVVVATALGASIGSRVQDPGHLLPAGAVAAAADVVSVSASWGPSHAIASSERALATLAVSFPVPGTWAVAPALGVGDLIFVALLLGAARAHALPYARVALLSGLGVLLAGFGSAAVGAPVPALPTVVVVVLLGVPGARRVRRKDKTVATIAVGTSIVVATWAVLSALRGSR